jgi:hypothetical protein
MTGFNSSFGDLFSSFHTWLFILPFHLIYYSISFPKDIFYFFASYPEFVYVAFSQIIKTNVMMLLGCHEGYNDQIMWAEKRGILPEEKQ